MSWPPDELWPRIAACWATHGAPSAAANERAKAFVALKQNQHDFDLSDCQLAFIGEHHALDPGSRIVKRERPENAFEITLGVIDSVGPVMPFEHLVIDSAWILHSYVFSQFLHTPRLLIHSRASGYGKTVRLNVIRELANQCFYMVAPTPAVLYHHLKNCPLSTLALDDAERMDWGRRSLLVQIIDAGHRKGAPIPRVFDREVVWYPTFAPMALGLILDRYLRELFLSQVAQVLTRSIVCEMKKSHEGLDDIVPGDPRFVPARAVNARWAETFRCPKTSVSLPPRIRARCANNYYALAAVADSLGYGATLRAAAVAIEAAGFDPEIQLFQDIHSVFERRQVDRLRTGELVQSLKEISDMWASLTNRMLYDQLWKKGIDYRTVWKISADGSRESGNGFYCKQFEAIWHELGIRHTDTQSRKIIRIAAHKRHTGDTHDE
jgi:hypothetical protein